MQMRACPFCGEKARLGVVTKWLRTASAGSARVAAYGRCKKCGARGGLAKTAGAFDMRDGSAKGYHRDQLINEAVVIWNGLCNAKPITDLELFKGVRE